MAIFGVRNLGVIGATVLLSMMFGSGVASADLTGETYDEAAAWIASHRGKAVIGSVTGNQLEKGSCVVSSWHLSQFLNSSGVNDRKNDFVLNLNCINTVASPGNPGNSVMTPQGAQGKRDQLMAAKIDGNPAWCQLTDKNMEYCQAICKRTGQCEV